MWQGGQCLKCGEGKCKVRGWFYNSYSTPHTFSTAQTKDSTGRAQNTRILYEIQSNFLVNLHYTLYRFVITFKMMWHKQGYSGINLFPSQQHVSASITLFWSQSLPAYWVKAERGYFCLFCANAEWGSACIGPTQNDQNSEYLGDFGITSFLAPIGLAWWYRRTKNILKVHVKYVISTLEGRNVWSWNLLLKMWLNNENI